MIEDIFYGGTYRDDNIVVTVTLEDPASLGISASKLVFTVAATKTDGEAFPEDSCVFYLMQDNNSIQNTGFIPLESSRNVGSGATCHMEGIISTEFRHEYLFQCLRVAFYYLPYDRIEIIQLKQQARV